MKRPTLNEISEMTKIRRAVLKYFELTEDEFNSKARTRDVALARFCFYYLVENYLKIQKSKVGYFTGGRDRTTVIHGIKTIRGFLEVGSDDARHLDPLSVMIGSHPNQRKIIAEYSSTQKGSLKACL
jgi:chromosomal replication initiation ATPase DnaA